MAWNLELSIDTPYRLPVANSLRHQLGSDGTIDTTTDGTDNLAGGANNGADSFDFVFNEGSLDY